MSIKQEILRLSRKLGEITDEINVINDQAEEIDRELARINTTNRAGRRKRKMLSNRNSRFEKRLNKLIDDGAIIRDRLEELRTKANLS